MSHTAKYVWAALIVAVAAHFAFIWATPRVMMNVAIERLTHVTPFNQWRLSDRVTSASRTIIMPSPDFAYSACAYDLSNGPLRLRVTPWTAYWSLSLYADNSDNYYVIDDREARNGAAIVLIRRGQTPPRDATNVVESPSERGIALIRRLAPTPDEYSSAAAVAGADVCGPLVG